MTREEQVEKAVSKVVEERQTAEGRKKYGGWDFSSWFLEGVKWADEHPINVWHDINEEPKMGKQVLGIDSVWHDAQVEEPEEDIEFLCDDDCINWCVRGWNCILPWEDYCRNNGITKWAYVRDLLPE
ncbi:MAG: hypothetical protein ACI36Z_09270 [Alloprevotella sp.]